MWVYMELQLQGEAREIAGKSFLALGRKGITDSR
jgi:hypothetical protein